ncbi:MAG: PTS cellobiose transporter subunit IIA [Micrococcaceae bacterium]
MSDNTKNTEKAQQNSSTSEEIQVVSFDLIVHSGQARTLVHKAMKSMRAGDFDEAQKYLDEAEEELLDAHKSQTKLLQEYAGGKKIEMEIILVHAQDHLMTTMTLREVAVEMMFIYQELAKKN